MNIPLILNLAVALAICAALYQQPWLPGVDYRGVFGGVGGITA